MFRIRRRSLCVFLLTMVFNIIRNGTAKGRKHTEMPMFNFPDFERAARRGSIAFPTLDELFTSRIENATQFVYEGCNIVFTRNENIVDLDLKDEKCQNVISIPRLYTKMTGNNLDDSAQFLPLKRFNVETVTCDMGSKDVSLTSVAKESFPIFRGTNVEVKKGELTLSFNHGTDLITFDKMGFDLYGEVPVNDEQGTMALSLIKNKTSPIGEFTLEAESVKIGDFFNTFTREDMFERRGEAEKTLFPAMFSELSLSKPRISGSRDAQGNTEVVASAPGGEMKKKIVCETFVDIGFIVDSSRSVRKDFEREKQFVKSLAAAFHMDTQGVRVGVITFSNRAVLDIKLNQYNNTASFESAMDSIALISSSTKIDKALRLAEKELFKVENGARLGIPKLVILITDGEHTGRKGEDPVDVAGDMRKKGINIVTIGVGKRVNNTELIAIAGDKNKTYNAKSFQDLISDDFMETVTKAVCSEATAGTPIDVAFDKISVVRSGLKGKISVTMSNGSVATGEIYENGNVHRGFLNFINGRRHNFWYYTFEATMYWDHDKGSTSHIWRGKPRASGVSTEFPGLQHGTFYIIVQIARGKPSEAGMIVKFEQVEPATLIGKILARDVKNVPIINDVTVDMIMEYANGDIGAPTDGEVVKLLKEYSPISGIEEGTKLKFKVPFKKLIERNGVNDVQSMNLDQYVRIVVVNMGKLSFEFPDNPPMNVEDMLVALGVKFESTVYKKAFPKSIDVKISTFEVFVAVDLVSIVMDSVDTVVVGNNLLSVEKATFTLKREVTSLWEFVMSSEMTLGDGRLKMEVTNREDKYTFVGTISQVRTMDLTEKFNITTTAGRVIKKIPMFNFGIKDFVMSTDFGDKLQLRMSGQATFLQWAILFEGYIVRIVDDEYEMVFGLALPVTGINDFATEMFSKSGKQIELVKADWLSSLGITIMVGNHGEIDFQTPELKQVMETTKKPLRYLFPVSEDAGAAVHATVPVPEDCRGEPICEFIKKTVGGSTRLNLTGIITPEEIKLKTPFQGDIKISDKFVLKDAMLTISVGREMEYSITGICLVMFEKTEMLFRARLRHEMSGKLKITFSMAGMWQSPFNITFLQFGNFEMATGVNFTTLQTTFILIGNMHIGYPGTAIKAPLSGGYEAGATPGYYFYAKFTRISVKAIFDAFNIQRELPKPVLDIEFPDGLVAGTSSPKGKRIDMFNADLRPTFLLQGECNVLAVSMYCEVGVDLPNTFYLRAEFPKIKAAGGAVEFSGLDQQSGPKVEITQADMFQITIEAYVEVLKIGGGVKVGISDDGVQFELVGRFLDLFESKLSITAPYGPLLTLGASQWKVQTCISDYVKEKLTGGAVYNVEESTNATSTAQRENIKAKGESGTWFNKAMEKISYWKQKLVQKEEKFQKAIDKIEKSKKDLDQSCVAKCDKRKVWVGGFGEKTCVIAGRNVQCPYWIPEKTMRDDPLCLADCEAGRFKIFSKIGSFFKSGDLMIMEEKMAFYSKMLDKVQSFVMSSKSLIENAELASKKVSEMVSATADALSAIKSYTLKNLFYLHHMCISATLEHAGKGLCFNIDAELYIGGKNGQKIHVKEEACFNLNWAYEIGSALAKTAFPGIENIKEKYRQTKELFTKSEKQAKDISEESKKVEKRDACDNDDNVGPKEKRCREASVHKKLAHYRSEDIYNSLPDMVVRNDESMQAFRDLFDSEPDHVTTSVIMDADAMVDGKMVNDMNLDPENLRNPDSCKRAQGVMNTYAGVLESINLLMAKNNNVKQSYEKFIKEYSDTFDALERKIRNDSITNNMSYRDTENAMFFVSRAKQGIARWKINYDFQYYTMDKSSLQNWRGFMAGFVGDKMSNIDNYLDSLGKASNEVTKRMDVPTNVKQELSRSLRRAEQVVRKLLQKDSDTFSSKAPSIRQLVNEVNNMNNIKKQLNCS